MHVMSGDWCPACEAERSARAAEEEERLVEAYLSEADEQDRAFDAWVDLGGEG